MKGMVRPEILRHYACCPPCLHKECQQWRPQPATTVVGLWAWECHSECRSGDQSWGRPCMCTASLRPKSWPEFCPMHKWQLTVPTLCWTQ